MINVSVLFFGATAEAVGQREINLEIADGSKAAEVFARLNGDFPELKRHSLLFSVNQEYASGGETINDGDELAIFTAVSGG